MGKMLLQKTYIRKQIKGEKTCGIRLEDIKVEDHYMCCHNCSKNFFANDLIIWLKKNKTCPLCRQYWVDKKRNIIQVYINNDIELDGLDDTNNEGNEFFNIKF